MNPCARHRAAFVAAEIKAHRLLATGGKGKAYRAAEKASERAYRRGKACSWAQPRLAGLGLPPLRPGKYPRGRALAATCAALRRAWLRSRGTLTTGRWAIEDRALAMGCAWARGR